MAFFFFAMGKLTFPRPFSFASAFSAQRKKRKKKKRKKRTGQSAQPRTHDTDKQTHRKPQQARARHAAKAAEGCRKLPRREKLVAGHTTRKTRALAARDQKGQ
jgi:hypothetical protein